METFDSHEEAIKFAIKQEGEADARARQTYRVLDGLDREQSDILRRLFNNIVLAGPTNGMLFAQYWSGYLTAKLAIVHDVSPIDQKTPQESLDDASGSS